MPVAQQAESADARNSNRPWTFSASVYAYFPPDTRSYLQPTLTADRNRLHLEARYNYEALDSGAAWIGYNFSGGNEVAWEFTPMLGGVFGKLVGIAPGYLGSLRWRGLEVYTEGEYVVDTADTSASYFYNWSELTIGVFDRFWIGAVVQHTHVYQSDREIQRGLLVGFSYKRADVTGYVFNPDEDTPTVVIALRLSW
jgi:hypothetical protein